MENHHAFVAYATSLEDAPIPETYKVQSGDVQHVRGERFSIDNARALILQAQQTPLQASHRVFVIVCEDIAVEAQNALLKLFEEPPQHARFYVVVPQNAHMLPTLQSRLMVIDGKASVAEREDFDAFKAADYAERLELIAAKTKNKDTQWIESVLHGCEEIAIHTKQKSLMENVLFVRRYIKTRGASSKMLLEALALELPRK